VKEKNGSKVSLALKETRRKERKRGGLYREGGTTVGRLGWERESTLRVKVKSNLKDGLNCKRSEEDCYGMVWGGGKRIREI